MSTTASAKPSTSYVSSSATATSQSTSVDMESSSAAPQSNSSTLSHTSTTSSLVPISSGGSSTDNLLPEKTSLNTTPSSSSEPEQVQTTTKNPFKTLSTKTDGVMASLSTAIATNPEKISTINGVTKNGNSTLSSFSFNYDRHISESKFDASLCLVYMQTFCLQK